MNTGMKLLAPNTTWGKLIHAAGRKLTVDQLDPFICKSPMME